ncbi:MAG: tagA [Clostridia bacterium]|jgi:N-acetylglucosaminyldiphosphoundecaprenol N-acetyl-beta-D-mannosaminyltransferase|uniref:WecB/TagA/CpsF family glycosyltransferase n=1 Tax=Petroclostridium xylanilyticum TaxID=1792311 RepID=UPI001FA86FFE|nr:WecB/TagA/CpsF family glycosyltransferase [Petroclostridium xylanilyticum]MBZ4645699.1 tagA [Clostridia bacterium]
MVILLMVKKLLREMGENMRDSIDILGTRIDFVTLAEAEQKVWNFLKEDKLHMVFTPNSEMIMAALKDDDLKKVLNAGDLNTADGIGVVYASKILGKPLKERVAGFDLAKRILAKLPQKKYTLYLLGGIPGIAETAKEKLQQEYPGIQIIGTHDGYFDEKEEQRMIEEINKLKPDIIFVCLGMSKQERWIYNNRNKLNARVCMGIGGSLDVFAGKAQRAPEVFQKLGLEWFYRLIKEPWRYKRMMALPKFAVTVMLKGKRCR